VLAPLIVLLAGAPPAARGFWRELSAALGYAGMAMAGIQFALTARFRHATAPFGVDIIYYFHRTISLMAAAVITAHVVIILADDPGGLHSLTWPPRLAGASCRHALLALAALITTSLFAGGSASAMRRGGDGMASWRSSQLLLHSSTSSW